MASTIPYLAGGSHQRSMTVEQNFSLGMMYSDNPLDEGYSKLLMNYSIEDGTIKPRPALVHQEAFGASLATDDAAVIATGLINIYTDPSKTDTKAYRVALCGGIDEGYADFRYTRLSVFAENGVVIGTPVQSYTGSLRMQAGVQSIHGQTVVHNARVGVSAIMDGVMYLSRLKTDGARTLAYIEANWNTAHNAVTYILKDITPNEITAVKAVNYGYNMLKATPYTFTNSQISTGTIMLDGIVPYDAQGNILTSARAGEEVVFHLVYRYPQSDVSSGTKYYVQWEIQDLTADSPVQVISPVRKSQAYTPGATISITTKQTVYKQFTIICKVYKKADIDAKASLSDIELSVAVSPLGTMTLAYYYLTNDKDSTQQNLVTQNYDLMTASGMCYWMNRLVIWGVQGCKNTLWISEINDPTYFPYPNNIELFETDIVKCVAYKKTLLVFTTSGIYQMEYAEDGLTLTNSVIQENMTIDEAAAASIIPVQNMVAFMAGNYYYMIVPAKITSTQAGQLTLAPISKPITNILDHFVDFVDDVLQVMDVEYTTAQILDWHCYLEQQWYRAVYKIQLDNDATCDLVLQYDTKLRTWTVHTYSVGTGRFTPFINSVTGQSVYITCTQLENLANIDLWQFDPSIAQDTDAADEDVPMFQYIDTGYRKLNEFTNINKKWRQIQFTITNQESEHLSFASEFRVDNDFRKRRYGYVAETDEDGNVTVNYELLDDDIDVHDTAWYTETAEEWGYDTHNFPDATTARVKVNINGKGRLPRFMLTSHNTVPYEINTLAWVFRTMTGR